MQYWFANIISRELDNHGNMQALSPLNNSMEEEASLFLKPSPTLSAARRIGIYNQQYWWRLLTVLQEVFPLVCRLFGERDFNKTLAIPYLLSHRPDTWQLGLIGKNFSKWIEKNYRKKDKSFVLAAAQVDWAYWELLLTPFQNPLSFKKEQIADLLQKPLDLQPTIQLFKFPFDLFSFRKEMISKEPSYWIEQEFPTLHRQKENYYFNLMRRPHKGCIYEEIEQGEWQLLKQFKKGDSIKLACKKLEKQGSKAYDQAQISLSLWMQKWLLNGMLLIK